MIPLLYVWMGSRRLTCEGTYGNIELLAERHSLLLSIDGKGKVWMNGKEYSLARGVCLVLKPGMIWRATNVSSSPMTLLLTEFDQIVLGGDYADEALEWELPEGQLSPRPFSRVEELAFALHDNREAADGLKAYRNNVLFQELIYLLLSERTKDGEHQAIRAVEQTIALLRQSPTLNFTLPQLAQEAGLSSRHYSRIFRKLMGQSPIDYQIGQRMARAKELLSTTDESIHRIAEQIGFHDPFHFSRSFKQHTGISPRLYTQLRQEKARLVSLQFLGEMLALGIKPVGAPTQLLAGRYYQPHIEGIQAVGEDVVTPNMDKLLQLKPDIIVTFNGHHVSDYAQIAHTLDISWKMPFFERFRLIADKIGKLDAAEQWLERYGQVAAETREQLGPKLYAGQTVSLLWMQGLPATFQAYFDVGLLYRDLGFQAPPAIVAVQQQREHPFKKDIPLNELASYAGDHVFVVVSSDPRSQREFRRLTASPQWQSLEAVRRGRVYRLNEDWVREDPISLLGQMQDTVRLMKID